MSFHKKKKKRKFEPLQITYKKHVGNHVYRSIRKSAPFSEWTRLTDKPLREGDTFTDPQADNGMLDYNYLMTDVDVHGNESAPYKPENPVWVRNGKIIPATPANTVAGYNMYWSEDKDLPLDQWQKFNDAPYTENLTIKCPIKTPFYMYCIYVNALGGEFGQPSDIERVEPRP